MCLLELLINVQRRSRKVEENGGISSTDTEKPRPRKEPHFFINSEPAPPRKKKAKRPPQSATQVMEDVPQWPCAQEERKGTSQERDDELPSTDSDELPSTKRRVMESDWREEEDAIPPSLMRSMYLKYLF